MKKNSFFVIVILLIFSYTACLDDIVVFDVNEIIGTWHVSETSDDGEQTFEVVIVKDASIENGLILKNFYDWNEDVKATYDLDFNIMIAQQTVDGLTISGQGYVDDNYTQINWNYTVIEGTGATPITVTAIFAPASIAKELGMINDLIRN